MKNDITRIKVTYISPDHIAGQKGISFISEFYISYYNHYAIYELPYHVTSEIDNVLIYDSTKYEYFVCSEIDRTGYLIKNINDSLLKKIAGDSIIATRAFEGGKGNHDLFSELKIKSIDKLKDTSLTIYRYLLDNYFYDSVYLHYKTSLKEVKFSFSKELDSTYNSKLSKIQLFIKHNKDTVPPGVKEDFYINHFEMEAAPSAYEQELKNLFNRFIKKENHQLKLQL